MKLVIFDQAGKAVELNDVRQETLMRAIRDSGMDLTAQCGGCASCATCHVYVDDAWVAKLEPLGATEDAMLDVAPERRANSRLSCQIRLTKELDGLTVTIAPGSSFAEA